MHNKFPCDGIICSSRVLTGVSKIQRDFRSVRYVQGTLLTVCTKYSAILLEVPELTVRPFGNFTTSSKITLYFTHTANNRHSR